LSQHKKFLCGRRAVPLTATLREAECSRYAFLSWERLQHSTECSVRENIEAFLEKIPLLLYALRTWLEPGLDMSPWECTAKAMICN
jgi:hypothetical protein